MTSRKVLLRKISLRLTARPFRWAFQSKPRMLKSNRRRTPGSPCPGRTGPLAGLLGVGYLEVYAAKRRALPGTPTASRLGQGGRAPPETTDGQEIGAWLVRGDRRKSCVLLLHGNGASRREMLPVVQWLAEAHFTGLAISVRAHGDSTGEINDIGWIARHDVAAAVTFLQRECPQQPVYIVGRSLGAAAAIFAAGKLDGNVAGYFLEQPYKDLKSAVWNRLHNHLPPVLDWAAYLGLRFWAPVFLPVDPDWVSPNEYVAKIPENVPVVFITGSADRHAPLADVKAMYRQIKSHAN